jgi:hypothetical protein
MVYFESCITIETEENQESPYGTGLDQSSFLNLLVFWTSSSTKQNLSHGAETVLINQYKPLILQNFVEFCEKKKFVATLTKA